MSVESVNSHLNLEKPNSVSDAENIIKHYLKEHDLGNYYPFAIVDEDESKTVGVFVLKKDIYRGEDSFECSAYFNEEAVEEACR